jgi:hypothetical protein
MTSGACEENHAPGSVGLLSLLLVVVQTGILDADSITTGIVTAASSTATAASTSSSSTATSATSATAPSTAAAATAGSRLARSGFVDCQATTVVFLVIQGLDCRPRFVVGAHFDEPEALAPTCVAVGDYLRALNTAEL